MNYNRTPADWRHASIPLLGTIRPADSTPLSIFFRATVSPWAWITYPVLLTIRVLLATGMLAFLILIFVMDKNKKMFPFLMGSLTWFGQCVYMWMAFYWTAISEGPHIDHRFHDDEPHSWYRFPTAGADAFATFYTTTLTLPLASSVAYWVYINPSHTPDCFSFLLHTANIAIVLLEVLVLNSIVKPGYVWVHLCVLAVLTVVYIELWVEVGNGFSTMRLREGWLDWRFFGGDAREGREIESRITWIGLGWVFAAFYAVWTLECYKHAMMAVAERWKQNEVTRWLARQRRPRIQRGEHLSV